MKIGIHIGFKIEDFEKNFSIDFFNNYVKFTPITFTKKYKTHYWDLQKFLKILKDNNYDEFLSASDHEDGIVTFCKTGTLEPHISIELTQESNAMMTSEDDLYSLIKDTKGFLYLYNYNEDYTYVQSETFENNLKESHISDEILNTISKTPFSLGVFDTKEYDTRFNPGRKVLSNSLWLVAGWRMWFGEEFYKYVPKKKLLEFKHAFTIKELTNNIVFIQLFQDLDKSHTPESMFAQWKWQELINYESM